MAEAENRRPGALLFVSAERKREVLDEISQGSVPHPLYYLLLTVSAGIAALGLIGNSSAVVIGAMLVSPLMSPIFGTSLALSRGDVALLRNALLAEFGGVALIIAFAFLIGLLPFALEVTGEMLARTRPTLIDLLVATLAGVAGGLAMIDERTSPMLPGVAIATSLTPPLATSGLCLAFGAYDGAWGAFLLFFANFLAILAVSAAIFIVAGFVTREQLGSKVDWVKRFSAAAIGLLAVTALLTRQLTIMIDEWRTRHAIVQSIERELVTEPGASLVGMVYRKTTDDAMQVLATVRTPRALSPQRVKTMQDSLTAVLGESVALFARCAITKEVAADGSVQLLPQVDLNGQFRDASQSREVIATETAEQVLRQLASETRAYNVRDVELLPMPTGPLIVATVEGSRPPIPIQVAFAQQAIRQRLADPTVTLLVRAITTSDVTAKGRVLIGAAHFGVMSAAQQALQDKLQAAGRTELAGLPDTAVDAIDAAPRGDGWVVRAETSGARPPRPSDVAAAERKLAALAGADVALSVWASTDLIVTRTGYESVPEFTRAQVAERLEKRGAASPDDTGAPVVPGGD